ALPVSGHGDGGGWQGAAPRPAVAADRCGGDVTAGAAPVGLGRSREPGAWTTRRVGQVGQALRPLARRRWADYLGDGTLAPGILFVVLGVATLGQTGLHVHGFAHTHVRVFGLHHTPLLGAGELGFGLLMLAAGAVPGAGRAVMAFLGVVALGAGLVVLIQPTS